jgi:hypothetical protein
MTEADPRVQPRALPNRRIGASARVAVDLLAQAWLTRSWLVLILVVVSIIGAASMVVGQNVVPLAIYPAL